MAKRFWPNEDAIGKRLTISFTPGVVREVVGIVKDVKLDALNETGPNRDAVRAACAGDGTHGEKWRSFGMGLVVRYRIPMNW